MKKVFGIGALAIAVCLSVSPAWATAMTVDGKLQGDWWNPLRTAGAIDGNVWAPDFGGNALFSQEDHAPVGIDPGAGGQPFDVEALFATMDAPTHTLYVAIATGFDVTGELGYKAGDLFIDFGWNQATRPGVGLGGPYPDTHTWPTGYTWNTTPGWDDAIGTWDTAIRVANNNSYNPGVNTSAAVYTANPNTGFAVGNLQSVLVSGYAATTGNPTGRQVVADFYRAQGLSSTGTATVAWGDDTAGVEHNVLEVGYHLTDAQWNAYFASNGSIALHWTMGCGNDFVSLGGSLDTHRDVPEPGTMVLLGLGLGGMVVRCVRRRSF